MSVHWSNDGIRQATGALDKHSLISCMGSGTWEHGLLLFSFPRGGDVSFCIPHLIIANVYRCRNIETGLLWEAIDEGHLRSEREGLTSSVRSQSAAIVQGIITEIRVFE